MTEPEQPPAQPGPIPTPPGSGYPPPPDGAAPYGQVPPGYAAPQYGAPPGYPPQGGYGYGYGYGYPPPKSGTNGMAIGAMVCGICGFACLVPGLVGIILGIVSLPQIKRYGQSGRGMAITGIVMGGLWILVAVLLIALGHSSGGQIGTGSGGSGGASV